MTAAAISPFLRKRLMRKRRIGPEAGPAGTAGSAAGSEHLYDGLLWNNGGSCRSVLSSVRG